MGCRLLAGPEVGGRLTEQRQCGHSQPQPQSRRQGHGCPSLLPTSEQVLEAPVKQRNQKPEGKGAWPHSSLPGYGSLLWPQFLYLPNGRELLDMVVGAPSEAILTDGPGALQKGVPLDSEGEPGLPSHS